MAIESELSGFFKSRRIESTTNGLVLSVTKRSKSRLFIVMVTRKISRSVNNSLKCPLDQLRNAAKVHTAGGACYGTLPGALGEKRTGWEIGTLDSTIARSAAILYAP